MKKALLLALAWISPLCAIEPQTQASTPFGHNTFYLGNMDPLITAIKGSVQIVGSTGPAGPQGAQGLSRNYGVTIGTLGVQGVNYASNTINGLNQALSDLGSSMMSTNTVPVTIFFKDGVYDMTGSSNGKGNLLWGVPGSSGVIFVINDDSKTIVTNYGHLSGINVDAGSRTFTSALINMKDNSEYDNFIIRGAQNQINRDGSAIINTYQSTHTRVHDGLFKEYIGAAGSSYEGQNGAVRTEFSTDTYHYRLTFSSIAVRSNTEALNPYRNVWVTVNSIGSRIEDSIFEGARSLSVDFNIGGWNNAAKRNKFYIGAGAERDGPNYGVITLDSDGSPAQGSSTMTWVDSNEFIFVSTGPGGGGSSCIRSRSIPTGIWAGILITNNVVSSIVRTNWYFYRQVGGSVFNAVLKDNTVYNMEFCFADSGTGTIWTSAGNTCNGILQ